LSQQRRPMLARQLSNHQTARLILFSRGNLKQIWILPESLRCNKKLPTAVFGVVSRHQLRPSFVRVKGGAICTFLCMPKVFLSEFLVRLRTPGPEKAYALPVFRVT